MNEKYTQDGNNSYPKHTAKLGFCYRTSIMTMTKDNNGSKFKYIVEDEYVRAVKPFTFFT